MPSTASSEDIAIRRCGRALDAAKYRLSDVSDGDVVKCVLWPPTPPPSFPSSSSSFLLPPSVPTPSRPSRPPPYALGCPVGWVGCVGECSGCVPHLELPVRQLERELGFAKYSSIPRCGCPPRWNRALGNEHTYGCWVIDPYHGDCGLGPFPALERLSVWGLSMQIPGLRILPWAVPFLEYITYKYNCRP